MDDIRLSVPLTSCIKDCLFQTFIHCSLSTMGSTLLLALAGCVMLALSVSAVEFNCQANYARMSTKTPKSRLLQPGLTNSHAACVNPVNGEFVITYFEPKPQIFIFNTCGWITKTIEIPSEHRTYSCGCAFVGSKLFISATRLQRILQFTSEGVFEKVFATGPYNFIYMAAKDTRLYVSVEFQRIVRTYDTSTGNFLFQFETTGDSRGVAIDPQGQVRVAYGGDRIVGIYTPKGNKVSQISYPEVSGLDGLTVDNETYSILADRSGSRIMIYDYKNLLTNRITGFADLTDVAMGYKCGYLLATNYGDGTYML